MKELYRLTWFDSGPVISAHRVTGEHEEAWIVGRGRTLVSKSPWRSGYYPTREATWDAAIKSQEGGIAFLADRVVDAQVQLVAAKSRLALLKARKAADEPEREDV